MRRAVLLACLLPLIAVTALLSPLHGVASVTAAVRPAVRPADHPLDSADLEAFFDGIMATHFQTYHIPGAAVAVVKDGKVLFAKGYGYADLESRTPVDAAKTLFRIGSVSKLFTWTAVMQLVERGMLDLNKDVNGYLAGAPFRVPATYPEPITVNHLMNHSAGFEDRGVGLYSHDPGSIRPLGEVLAGALPERIRPPGEATAYSNHGTALAGYVVELVSGIPWATYIEGNILEPLHMDHTTARQPVPSDLKSLLATGYEYVTVSARFEPRPFEYVPAAPAGAFSASAVDMARFTIAHLQSRLQSGRPDGQILKPGTIEKMQSTSLTQDRLLSPEGAEGKSMFVSDGVSDGSSSLNPWLGGIAHGFLEQPYGRLRTIGHGGDTFLFHSELRLVPSQNLGIFVTYSSPDGAIARDQLMQAFLDRYFASYADWPNGRGADGAGLTGELSRYYGVYRSTRVPITTMDRLLELLSAFQVRRDPGDRTGSSLLVTLPGREPERFTQVKTGIFQEADGPGRIAFVTGQDGRPDLLLMGSAWMAEKMSWYQTPRFQAGIAVACLLLFLSAVTASLVVSVRRRRLRRSPRSHPGDTGSPKGERLARWLAGLESALFLVVLVFLSMALRDPMKIAFGVPPAIRLGLALSLVAALLSPIVALAALLVWRNRYFTLAGRVHFTLVALASVVFAMWLNHWNLLGFRF